MKRSILAGALVGGLVVLATVAGCPGAHDDYPGASCKTTNDCFKGEVCTNSICVQAAQPADMAVVIPPMPDLRPGEDMAMPQDAGDDLL